MSEEPLLLPPDPPDAEAVWSVGPGQKVRSGPRYLMLAVLLLVPVTLTGTLGSISFSSPDGTAIVSFWPAAALQIVFTIWFGVYGAIAGIIGPMLGNGLVGDSPFLYIPANAVQCCVAGLWFRYRKLDPRLRSRRDWLGLIFVGCILGNALGGTVGVTESYIRSLSMEGSGPGLGFWLGKLLTWFGGNTVPCLFLAPALLKAASPIVVRGPIFCQSFWGGTNVAHRRGARFRFGDLSMVGKLMVLAVAAGLLPLLLVAAWSIWGSVRAADHLAVEINRQAAHEIRNETERHELMLRLWAAELDRPELNDEDRERLLGRWGATPEAFEELEIADLGALEREMPPKTREVFREQSVTFYRVGEGSESVHDGGEIGESQLRAVFRLSSAPDKALTGLVVWRQDMPLTGQWADVEAVLVFDKAGNELYRNAPVELEDWKPEKESPEAEACLTVRHGGRTWHLAQTELARLGWRFVTMTSAHAGLLLTSA